MFRDTTLSHSRADCLEILDQLPGTLRDCPGPYRNCFTFTFADESNPKHYNYHLIFTPIASLSVAVLPFNYENLYLW